MNADDFLRHVERTMPTRADLGDYGLDDAEIREVQSTFMAPRRAHAASVQTSTVERMILDFDCSKLELGLVRFNERPFPLPAGSCFAVCEADPLVVTESGSIALCDHAKPESLPRECAATADTFLDAMAVFASVRADKRTWLGKVENAAQACAEAAGGQRYVHFFRSLCAFLNEST